VSAHEHRIDDETTSLELVFAEQLEQDAVVVPRRAEVVGQWRVGDSQIRGHGPLPSIG
jgi:hypothetical protein